jgi:large subunit ribosomal protein L37Ae
VNKLPRTKKVGHTGGLGVRYGATVRKRYMKVTAGLKIAHKCPQCGFVKVKRLSVGVWKCGKCDFTFTGGAYMPATKLGAIAKRSAKGAPVEAATKAATEEETSE